MKEKKYHFWITGCQMNYADARRVATRLEKFGYRATSQADDADVIVLETCTVRQQSEDKAYNKLHALRPLKEDNPQKTIAVMGCVVGVRGNEHLSETFPFVDVFMEPASDGSPLITHLMQSEALNEEQKGTLQRHLFQDGEVILPLHQRGRMVAAPVSVVYGCSHACTFCIIPQKRGKERSRPIGAIASEARALVRQGVKEVMLLGQIVDRYGYDVPDGPDLSDLLHAVHEVQGLERIRFLTSHPNYLSDRILTAVRDLPRVMPQIEVPVQAGDDVVLENMRRGYTANQYRELVTRIRNMVPDAAVHCDIIVGFPGETEEQFQRTYDLLEELRLDKLHLARYSPRRGTVSERNMSDDVPEQEKRRRHQLLEALNERISEEKMGAYLGRTVPVLVEGKRKKRWFGREPRGKLVFFEDSRKLRGQLVDVTVTHTGAWSMSGRPADKVSVIATTVASKEKPDTIPLNVL